MLPGQGIKKAPDVGAGGCGCSGVAAATAEHEREFRALGVGADGDVSAGGVAVGLHQNGVEGGNDEVLSAGAKLGGGNGLEVGFGDPGGFLKLGDHGLASVGESGGAVHGLGVRVGVVSPLDTT